jgi:hypothetical protein
MRRCSRACRRLLQLERKVLQLTDELAASSSGGSERQPLPEQQGAPTSEEMARRLAAASAALAQLRAEHQAVLEGQSECVCSRGAGRRGVPQMGGLAGRLHTCGHIKEGAMQCACSNGAACTVGVCCRFAPEQACRASAVDLASWQCQKANTEYM